MNGLHRLQKYLLEHKLDSIILINPINLHYFAGFTGTTAVAFITPDKALIVTDSRYTEQAQQQCENYEVLEYTTSVWSAIGDFMADLEKKPQLCGFEGNHVPFDTYQTFTEALPKLTFMSVRLEGLRAVKREDELEYMRQAARIAGEAYEVTLQQIKPGMTENMIRIILETEMLKRGSTEPSFATIIASGQRSSMPHGVASDKVVEEGDFITFDFGAVYKGYHSDMTRTVVVGQASALQKELYHIVLTAQEKGVAAVKAGLAGKDLDELCRESIRQAGYGAYFNHGLGHGVGLEIHEEPVASPRSASVLEKNMVVTVEPGVYLPGRLGLRIEDSVIVNEDGCEILTTTPKQLIELTV